MAHRSKDIDGVSDAKDSTKNDGHRVARSLSEIPMFMPANVSQAPLLFPYIVPEVSVVTNV